MTITRDPSLGVWLYSPSLLLSILATVLYAIPFAIHLFLMMTKAKYRSWPSLWILLGALLEVVGYAARIASTRDYNSVGAYAIQSTLIILAPLLVAAANYLLLSALVLSTLPATAQRTFFRIDSFWLADVFVVCDIVTFIVQASGAAIVASGIKDLTTIGPGTTDSGSVGAGNHILIGGLAVQVVTFGVFIALAASFHRRAAGLGLAGWGKGWLKVLLAIYISSGCILIRTVYRLVEFGLGVDGYPFSHEWIFYVFESLPMLPAIAIFCVIRPAEYLQKNSNLLANNVQLHSRLADSG